jgi:hypothetical protein
MTTESNQQNASLSERAPRTSLRWVWFVSAGAMLLTLLPYLFGVFLRGTKPAFGWYAGLTYNFDDSCVYLAWLRQAADGHFFQRNLFTTAPQTGHSFSLFFVLLGFLARLLPLPLIFVWHGARLVLGMALLRAVWWLLTLTFSDDRTRRAGFLLVAFSAGLGWIPGLWQAQGFEAPVDVWQPEAITFLSLTLNPLFLVSLLLMVGVLGWLRLAEQTRSLRCAVYAGLCAFLLGNIHGYDILTLSAVWGVYMVARTIRQRRFDAFLWGCTLLVGAMAAVSAGYAFYLLKTEQVFAQRVAVETLSPPFVRYLLGYGIVFGLAVYGGWRLWRREAKAGKDDSSESPALFLTVWAGMNLAAAYLPVSFQRKMVMGAHLPLCLLAGVALSALLERRERRQANVVLALGVLLLGLTNLRFLQRDIENTQNNRAQSGQRPYLYSGEIAALLWLRDHAPEGAALQPLPWALYEGGKVGFFDTTLACLTPALTGHPVHAGHWGETPEFGRTMGDWLAFTLPRMPDEARRDLLRRSGVRYLLFTQKHDVPPETERLLTFFREPGSLPSYLRRIPEASNEDADVYEVTGL